MKKVMVFMPIWFTGLKTWINKAIKRMSEKEDLCLNCDRYVSCRGFKVFKKIKEKFGIKFILTRCKRFQHDHDNQIRHRTQTEEFFGVIVRVNAYTENLREKQCMCINDCRNLDIKNRERNCPTANKLYDACVRFNTATIVYDCKVWNMPQELI